MGMATPEELQAVRQATGSTWAQLAVAAEIPEASIRSYASGFRVPSPAVNARLDQMIAAANRGLGQPNTGWTFGQIAAAGGLLAFLLWLGKGKR